MSQAMTANLGRPDVKRLIGVKVEQPGAQNKLNESITGGLLLDVDNGPRGNGRARSSEGDCKIRTVDKLKNQPPSGKSPGCAC
jgi:hypothetical protein